MHRFFAPVLALVMLLALVSCDKPAEEQKKPPEVHYNTTIMEWFYQPETEDDTTKALIAIDLCQYGTAGASLRQLAASVGMLQLTAEDDFEEKLDAYLAGMDDTQRDFFSFQWQMRMKHATLLLTPDNVLADMLGDVGMGDVDLSLFSQEDLNKMDAAVMAKLQGYGVADEWKNHKDLEPFAHWSE